MILKRSLKRTTRKLLNCITSTRRSYLQKRHKSMATKPMKTMKRVKKKLNPQKFLFSNYKKFLTNLMTKILQLKFPILSKMTSTMTGCSPKRNKMQLLQLIGLPRVRHNDRA